VALVLKGDIEQVKSIFHQTLTGKSASCLGLEARLSMATAAAQAYRQLVLRRLDAPQDKISERTNGLECIALLAETVKEAIMLAQSELDSNGFCNVAASVLECADTFGDGKAALDLIGFVLSHINHVSCAGPDSLRTLYERIRRVACIPTVRVINLQSRTDRMKSFMAQALRENVLVVLAVADLKDEAQPVGEGYYFGKHGFSGLGRMAEVHGRLSEQLGGVLKISSLVKPQWCPNDLKPFDKDAPDNEDLSSMTDSEVACALSHVASWHGALRSFKLESERHSGENIGDLFSRAQFLRRLFRLSGFAEGPALDSRNDCMPPAPVCLILEDDAILVDRFRERLAELLKELPRDFHYCSLGYSRPKTAPILPYNNTCGIPSHLFYLTGYILSSAGAAYLLDSLPVVGPVDSWIAFKMTSNWDNAFGTALGVGVHSRPNCDLPSRKDLCRILQFRAFCALQPLCSQRVGRSWRERDTDVDYSGHRTTIR